MQRFLSASVVIAAMLGPSSLQAKDKIQIEVVQTSTYMETSRISVAVSGTPATSITHCDGTSGVYSREFGFNCTTTSYPATPQYTEEHLLFSFIYEAQVIMPDGARLNLGCSKSLSKHCEGFASYPDKTQITCSTSVTAETSSNNCTAVGADSHSIGIYEAERHGEKVVVHGPKWRREYVIRGSWETAIRPPASQDPAKLGIEVGEVSSDTSERKGVLVQVVKPASFADNIGLKSGDVILEINKQPVRSIDDFNHAQSALKAGDDVVFLIRLGFQPGTIFLAGTLP